MNNFLTECTNCGSIKGLLSQIDNSIVKRIQNKWSNVIYNTELYFNPSVYKDLLWWKRILENKVININYPIADVDNQDVIGKITLILNK